VIFVTFVEKICMIAHLRGTLESISKDSIVVGIGGVGFRVHPSAMARARLSGVGQAIELFTHLHVRENELSLYGFAGEEELALFELLLGVSGVGPKAAMAVLASGPPDVLRAAIANEQADVLTRVPGVGMRTAKAIILHLKDKVGGGLMPAPVSYLTDADAELLSALTGLGYSVVEAQTALASLPRDPSLPVEERLRQALAYFAK
jgi:Holliday junction DNA helicase RuvA